MDHSDAVQSLRGLAVLVRVQGPDPKGQKLLKHSFYSSDCGFTRLSCSGIFLPGLKRFEIDGAGAKDARLPCDFRVDGEEAIDFSRNPCTPGNSEGFPQKENPQEHKITCHPPRLQNSVEHSKLNGEWRTDEGEICRNEKVECGRRSGRDNAIYILAPFETFQSFLSSSSLSNFRADSFRDFSSSSATKDQSPFSNSKEIVPSLIQGAEIHILMQESDIGAYDEWRKCSLVSMMEIQGTEDVLASILFPSSRNASIMRNSVENWNSRVSNLSQWNFSWPLTSSVNSILQTSVSDWNVRFAILRLEEGIPEAKHLLSSIASTYHSHSIFHARHHFGHKETVSERKWKEQQTLFANDVFMGDGSHVKKGDTLSVIGSPFGILSPLHFMNSVTFGVLSNVWIPRKENPFPSPRSPTFYVLDVKCFPGMEGGPIIDSAGKILGVLLRPLYKSFGNPNSNSSTPLQIQLGLPIDVIINSLNQLGFYFDPDVEYKNQPKKLNANASSLYHSHESLLRQEKCLPRKEKPYFPISSRTDVSLPLPSSTGLCSFDHILTSHSESDYESQSNSSFEPKHLICPILFPNQSILSYSPFITDSQTLKPTTLSESEPGTLSTQPLSRLAISDAVNRAQNFVVLISVGGLYWGSGILLNSEGLILTNAHLFVPSHQNEKAEKNTVSQRPKDVAQDKSNLGSMHRNVQARVSTSYLNSNLRNGPPWRWLDAHVVFISHGVLDLALLKLALEKYQNELNSSPSSSPSFYSTFLLPPLPPPRLGTPVFVVGHGLFGPATDLEASVSMGVLSNVVHMDSDSLFDFKPENGRDKSIEDNLSQHSTWNGTKYGISGRIPVMYQTSAAVHAGNSGGPLLDMFGNILGIVTSRAKHVGGSELPHLNFCIPSILLCPILEYANSGEKDLNLLKFYDQHVLELSSVWTMNSKLANPLPRFPFPENFVTQWVQTTHHSSSLKGKNFRDFLVQNHDILNFKSNLPKSSHSKL